MAPATSRPQKIAFSTIPSHLQQQILRKLDVKCFIPMRNTCSSMVSMVEECWKNLKYENMTIASLKSISLCAQSVKIVSTNPAAIERLHNTLPTKVLDSFVWKFVDFRTLKINDEENGKKFLEKMRHTESTRGLLLSMYGCPVSTAVEAMKILKPGTTHIMPHGGDVHEILPQLPLCALYRNGSVNAIGMRGVFDDADGYLQNEGFEIVEDGLDRPNHRVLIIKSPSGHYFSLELSKTIVLCIQKIVD